MWTAPKKTMRNTSIFASLLTAAALTFFGAPDARADLSSCGDLDIGGNAKCELDTSGGCTARCTPISVVASCSAQLQTSCSGSCSVTADANCTGSCQTSCEGTCNANPGTYDCEGDCTGTCEADCSGKCSASSESGNANCTEECKANCGGSCHAKCSGTPPSATCTARCQSSCSGSCTAEVNASCNIDCQAKGEASCEATVTGGCKAQCTQPKGALFCDGQFVNASNLDDCVSSLVDLLHIQVSGSASSECDGGECSAEAQGQASASCSAAPNAGSNESPIGGSTLFAGVGLLGIAVARRKKNRS
jgi:hypothetical protein